MTAESDAVCEGVGTVREVFVLLGVGATSRERSGVAALFYSLIESAKLCGVEPRACLREATCEPSGTRAR